MLIMGGVVAASGDIDSCGDGGGPTQRERDEGGGGDGSGGQHIPHLHRGLQ